MTKQSMPHPASQAKSCPVCQAMRGKVAVVSVAVAAGSTDETTEVVASIPRWILAAHEAHKDQLEH
jgi:hypothetical protein